MEKKEGMQKSFTQIDEVLMPDFVKSLGRRMKVRVTYEVTVSNEEAMEDPRRAGLFALEQTPEEALCRHELAELVKDILNHKILTERERRALRLCFGIGCKEHTPAEAARKMGTGSGNVRSAVRSAIRKLRRHGKCACLRQFHK